VIVILTGVNEREVLSRLLSSQAPQHVCTCQQAPAEIPGVEPLAPGGDGDLPLWSGQPWTAEEDAAISGCASPLLARRAYRRAFPHSDRTNDAIKARLLALKRARKEEEGSDAIAADLRDECAAEQIEAEIEATGEPAGRIDSEIAAEMEEDVPDDLSRLDPTLAGLSDASAPGRRECTGKEKAEGEGDKPLPLRTRVRILLQGSKYSGCEGEIVRQTQNPGEYVVVPDGACARFVMTRKDLEVLL
jgi:hypothetical protein